MGDTTPAAWRVTTHAYYAPGTAILVGAVHCADDVDPDPLALAAGIVGERRGSVDLYDERHTSSPRILYVRARASAVSEAQRSMPSEHDVCLYASDHREWYAEMRRRVAVATASVPRWHGPENQWARRVKP